MTKTYPRQKIAAEISDLRQMRGALADIISTACGLMGMASAADVPEEIRLRVVAALSAAEEADKLAQERMRSLYNVPTVEAANDEQERAA